jgi:phthiocerol/phenolphthiocerol synthesis type-I polyketide synthase D
VVRELEAAGGGDDWAGPDSLRDLDPAEVTRVMTDLLRSRIAAVMGYADKSAVDPGLPLLDLGMDSLMAVRIRNTARADFGAEPPVALLLQGATLHDLTADLMRQLGLSSPDPATETSTTVRDRAQQRAAARQNAAQRRRNR